MNELKIFDFHGKQVIDSRDVAQMVERSHYELLKSIRQYAEHLNEGEIPVVDFFIESSYIDSKGQSRPNFLITKKGCDMIANKITGKKGILFTAAYVSAFEEMRRALTAPHRSPEVSPAGLAKLISITRRVMLDMDSSPADVGSMVRDVFRAYNFPIPTALSRQIEGQTSFFDLRCLPQKSA